MAFKMGNCKPQLRLLDHDKLTMNVCHGQWQKNCGISFGTLWYSATTGSVKSPMEKKKSKTKEANHCCPSKKKQLFCSFSSKGKYRSPVESFWQLCIFLFQSFPILEGSQTLSEISKLSFCNCKLLFSWIQMKITNSRISLHREKLSLECFFYICLQLFFKQLHMQLISFYNMSKL